MKALFQAIWFKHWQSSSIRWSETNILKHSSIFSSRFQGKWFGTCSSQYQLHNKNIIKKKDSRRRAKTLEEGTNLFKTKNKDTIEKMRNLLILDNQEKKVASAILLTSLLFTVKSYISVYDFIWLSTRFGLLKSWNSLSIVEWVYNEKTRGIERDQWLAMV